MVWGILCRALLQSRPQFTESIGSVSYNPSDQYPVFYVLYSGCSSTSTRLKHTDLPSLVIVAQFLPLKKAIYNLTPILGDGRKRRGRNLKKNLLEPDARIKGSPEMRHRLLITLPDTFWSCSDVCLFFMKNIPPQ